jgi:hypothetical protein
MNCWNRWERFACGRCTPHKQLVVWKAGVSSGISRAQMLPNVDIGRNARLELLPGTLTVKRQLFNAW